jgi:hypothetical protein
MLKKCIPKKSYHEGKGREEGKQIEFSLTRAERKENKYYGEPDGREEVVLFYYFSSGKEVYNSTGEVNKPGE